MQLHTPGAWLRVIARNAKRLMVFIVGVAVLLAGLAMLALPGPGVLVIILDRTTSTAAGAASRFTDNNKGRAALAASGIGLIIGGIVVAVMFERLQLMGVSLTVAGAIGLVTLLPQVRTWIDAKADATA
jgi:hypothetical protein